MTDTQVDVPEAAVRNVVIKPARSWPRRLGILVLAGLVVGGAAFGYSVYQSDQDKIDALRGTVKAKSAQVNNLRLRVEDQQFTLSEYKSYADDAEQATGDLSDCVDSLLDFIETIATLNTYLIDALDVDAVGTQCGTARGEGLTLYRP